MASRNSALPLSSSFRLQRRGFLATVSGTALATHLGFSSTLLADDGPTTSKPLIQVWFVGPKDDKYWMSWPGASFDPQKCQDQCCKHLTAGAVETRMRLSVDPLRLDAPEGISTAIEQIKSHRIDGLIIVPMHLRSWPQTQHLAQQSGDLPTIVFAVLGTAFANRIQETRKQAKTLVVSTDDVSWLHTGMRMLRTVHDLRQMRICMVTDAGHGDEVLAGTGTTLHFVPMKRWVETVRGIQVTEEIEDLVKQYAINAQEIVEPTKETLLEAGKNSVAARQLMAEENCQAISVDCSPLVCQKSVACGPCLAWSRLLDEGHVAACEADADAAISQLIASRLLRRPGFMQDPAPNSVNNTIIGSHCTCPTHLSGFDKPAAPFSLRSHSESDTGVSLRVEWQKNQPVTLMKFERPGTLAVGTGQVSRNVKSDLGGGCRTAVEIAIDGLEDSRDFQGFHQVVVYGKFDRELKSFAELAGLNVRGLGTVV